MAFHAGLPPIVPPGTELTVDALPTEAEVCAPGRATAGSPPAKLQRQAQPEQVHVLREDGLSATMISADNFLSAAEYAARRVHLPPSPALQWLPPPPPPPLPPLPRPLLPSPALLWEQVGRKPVACRPAGSVACLPLRRCAAWIAWGEAAPFQHEKHAQTAHIAHRDNGRCAQPVDSAGLGAPQLATPASRG